jgi:hypothetical protein
MGETSSTHREIRNSYDIMVGKPEGKRPFGGPKRRCQDIRNES